MLLLLDYKQQSDAVQGCNGREQQTNGKVQTKKNRGLWKYISLSVINVMNSVLFFLILETKSE